MKNLSIIFLLSIVLFVSFHSCSEDEGIKMKVKKDFIELNNGVECIDGDLYFTCLKRPCRKIKPGRSMHWNK